MKKEEAFDGEIMQNNLFASKAIKHERE